MREVRLAVLRSAKRKTNTKIIGDRISRSSVKENGRSALMREIAPRKSLHTLELTASAKPAKFAERRSEIPTKSDIKSAKIADLGKYLFTFIYCSVSVILLHGVVRQRRSNLFAAGRRSKTARSKDTRSKISVIAPRVMSEPSSKERTLAAK